MISSFSKSKESHARNRQSIMILMCSGFVAWLGFVCCGAAMNPVHAQMRVVHAPERLQTDQTIKIYIGNDGIERFDGAYLALPVTWSLNDVSLLSEKGRSESMRFKKSEKFDNRFYLFASRGFSRGNQIVLEVDTGYLTSAGTIKFIPFQMDRRRFEPVPELKQEFALQDHFRVDRPVFLGRNRVLELTEERPGVVLPKRILPDMSAGSSFTAELWLKTTSADAVVLSTWNGDDSSTYPLELMIDESGHVAYFRGVRGEHQMMRSAIPIADGTWHHVAVSHNGETGWSRLFLDGTPSDSLFSTDHLSIKQPSFLSISGRFSDKEDEKSAPMRMAGFVDEVRIWPEARDLGMIKSAMRSPIPSTTDKALVLSFDDNEPASEISRRTAHLGRVRSELSFYEGVEKFELQVEAHTVLLSWTASDPEVTGFMVERSVDGAEFETIAVIVPELNRDPQNNTVTYRDTDAPDSVAFYRIRQRFHDGVERVTAPIKVGMGSDDASLPAALTGNYPNPFNPATTITYQVREAGIMKITVWDLSGQEIATLYSGPQEIGEYQVDFDGQGYPSGTYFVRLRTEDGVSSHQMILMK